MKIFLQVSLRVIGVCLLVGLAFLNRTTLALTILSVEDPHAQRTKGTQWDDADICACGCRNPHCSGCIHGDNHCCNSRNGCRYT